MSIGKEFPGGQYPASRILTTTQYDTLNRSAHSSPTGRRSWLAGLPDHHGLCRGKQQYVSALGDHYTSRLNELVAEFPGLLAKVEGRRHLGALVFHEAKAVAFMKIMNQGGYDVSAQAYIRLSPAI